jgi:hypothetical protein
MSKLTEMANTLRETDRLISEMKAEINELRFLVARYHAKHGTEIQGGEMILPDNIGFETSITTCRRVDYDIIGVESRYQIILKALDEL